MTIFCLDLNNNDVFTVEGVYYCCIIHGVSQSEAIHLLENSCQRNQCRNDELPNDITWKNVVILITYAIKDGDKFYQQLVLEEELFLK